MSQFTVEQIRNYWTGKDMESAKALIQFNYTPDDWVKHTDEIMPVFLTPRVVEYLRIHEHMPKVALDIGCGVGRLMVRMREHFSFVIGVDVTPKMIELAEHYLMEHQRSNLDTYQWWTLIANDGRTFPTVRDLSVDFAYSMITFQHIHDRDQIQSYLRETRRVLRIGGLARIQTHVGNPADGGPPDGYLYSSLTAFEDEFREAGLMPVESQQGGPWLWVTAERQS